MGHPNDTIAPIPKFIVVFGLWLSCCNILILPFDVSNHRSDHSLTAESMSALWDAVYTTLAMMLGFFFPFAFFYYEGNTGQDLRIDRNCCETQIGIGFRQALMFLIAASGLLARVYIFVNTVEVPVERVAQSANWVIDSSQPFPNWVEDPTNECPTIAGGVINLCLSNEITWFINVSFVVFVVSICSFFGWFCLSIFGGVGSFALPMDLINAFRTRTTPLDLEEYTEKKRSLAKRATELVDATESLLQIVSSEHTSRSQKRQANNTFAQLQNFHHLLAADVELLETVRHLRSQNPLKLFGLLFFGIFSMSMSILWMVHICIFMVPSDPVDDFLNSFLMDLENIFGGDFPIFGVLAYGLFCFYFLACVVYGQYKLGIRFLLWKVYPMKIGETMLNSFIVNAWVIMLSSIPIVHFAVLAFPSYAKFTDVNMVFGTQASYLSGIRYVYDHHLFEYLMVLISIFTLLVGIFHPDNESVRVHMHLIEMKRAREEMAGNAKKKTAWQKFKDKMPAVSV